VLAARPISGEVAADDAAPVSSKSIDLPADSKPGLSFPSAVSAEMPFRGDTELFSSATRATGSVVLLVGLILIGTFLLKRYWPGRFGAVAGERHIEVLETVALGERQSLTLVQVGQSRLLLARTAGTITLLDRAEVLPEALLEDEMDAQAEQQAAHQGNAVRAVMPVSVRVFKPIEARLKAVLARLGTSLRCLPSKSRDISAVKAPSFEQIMHAELGAAASTAARSSGSRLSEIRNQLQAE
jgi:flagellar biogenesis protein FliO